MTAFAFRIGARWVFPVEGEPIADGLVEITDGRLTRVGPREGDIVDLDLGNAAILPGLVNAHTHLELETIPWTRPVPEPQVAWLWRVIASRRERPPEAARAAVEANIARSLASGTTTIADITTNGLSWPALFRSPLRGTVFSELIGLRRERGLQTSRDAWEWLAEATRAAGSASSLEPGRMRLGLSPHAPYSTAGWLYQRAAESRLPLSTHLAEMPEEREFLATRRGPLRTFLEDLGAWDPEWQPLGDRPADYVRRGPLRQSDWLIAHGNYFTPEDFLQFLPSAAGGGQRVAIAYCPRTHARFGHAPHPFRELLERGATVCLGTDSLGSTPTLSILDEMRFVSRQVAPDVGGRTLLLMATLLGAWALRRETEVGSLATGKAADLAIVGLPDREESDPHRLILDSDLPVAATMIGGRFVFGPYSGAEDASDGIGTTSG